MPLFRRGRADPDEDEALRVAAQPEQEPVPGRTTGPYDVEHVDDDVHRLDLGSLRVPVPDGCEVRVDMQDDQVVAATLVDGRSALQIHAFAAPRSTGIWAEVRAEITESLRSSGGSAEETDGPFGPELRARIPGPESQQQPARFIGVDGPRWFLRGLVTGAASTDAHQAGVLEAAFRNVVVVRGGEAMAPRDLLPLKLPKEALAHLEENAGADGGDDEPAKPTLDMLERGPEITETR